MLRIGIAGLAQVGKTTLFQILTRAHGSGHGAGRPEMHIGVVRVPDARLDRRWGLVSQGLRPGLSSIAR